MPRRAFSWSRLPLSLLAVGAALLTPLGAHAQTDSLGNKQDLLAAHGKHRNRFEILLKGEDQPGAEDRAVADAFSQWYIYPLTWETTKREEVGEMKGRNLILQLENHIKTQAIPYATKNQEFMKLWTERTVATLQQAFNETLKHPKENRVAIVNIALLLPIYARARHEKFGEYLESLLADEKQHDVVKLYAVKALRQYLPARARKLSDDPDDENYKALQQTIARDTRRVEVLLKFVNRKWDGMDPVVAQYVRREALQTLADARVPAMDLPKGGKVVSPVAYTLLRFLTPGKDGPNPPPSLSEKVEAAIGVLKLDTRGVDGYNPEPGLYLAGQFLMEFTTEYRKDFARFGGKVAVKLEKGERRSPPELPWKFMGERLVSGLEGLKNGIRIDHPAHAKAMKLQEKARNILGTVVGHGQIGDTASTDLVQSVNALQPPSGALYKGSKQYQVPLAPPAGE